MKKFFLKVGSLSLIMVLMLNATTVMAGPNSPTDITVTNQSNLITLTNLPGGSRTQIFAFKISTDPNGVNQVIFTNTNQNSINVTFEGSKFSQSPFTCDLVRYVPIYLFGKFSGTFKVVHDTATVTMNSTVPFDFTNSSLTLNPGQLSTFYVECDTSGFTTDNDNITAGLFANNPINYTSGNQSNYSPNAPSTAIWGPVFVNP